MENQNAAQPGPSAASIGSLEMVADLTDAVESATDLLMNAVATAYPLGTILRVAIRRNVWIEAEVIRHRRLHRYPHELLVSNVATGKTRNISVDPRYGNRVEILMLPENKQICQHE